MNILTDGTILGTHKRMGNTTCKNDLMAYALCILILFAFTPPPPLQTFNRTFPSRWVDEWARGNGGEEERGGSGGKLVQCRKEKLAAVFHAAKGRERGGKGE